MNIKQISKNKYANQLTFLRKFSDEINNDIYNKLGRGLFFKKTPDGIKKLRLILAKQQQPFSKKDINVIFSDCLKVLEQKQNKPSKLRKRNKQVKKIYEEQFNKFKQYIQLSKKMDNLMYREFTIGENFRNGWSDVDNKGMMGQAEEQYVAEFNRKYNPERLKIVEEMDVIGKKMSVLVDAEPEYKVMRNSSVQSIDTERRLATVAPENQALLQDVDVSLERYLGQCAETKGQLIFAKVIVEHLNAVYQLYSNSDNVQYNPSTFATSTQVISNLASLVCPPAKIAGMVIKIIDKASQTQEKSRITHTIQALGMDEKEWSVLVRDVTLNLTARYQNQIAEIKDESIETLAKCAVERIVRCLCDRKSALLGKSYEQLVGRLTLAPSRENIRSGKGVRGLAHRRVKTRNGLKWTAAGVFKRPGIVCQAPDADMYRYYVGKKNGSKSNLRRLFDPAKTVLSKLGRVFKNVLSGSSARVIVAEFEEEFWEDVCDIFSINEVGSDLLETFVEVKDGLLSPLQGNTRFTQFSEQIGKKFEEITRKLKKIGPDRMKDQIEVYNQRRCNSQKYGFVFASATEAGKLSMLQDDNACTDSKIPVRPIAALNGLMRYCKRFALEQELTQSNASVEVVRGHQQVSQLSRAVSQVGLFREAPKPDQVTVYTQADQGNILDVALTGSGSFSP